MLILVLLPLRITNLVSKNECFSINEPHKAAVTQVTTEVFQKLHKLCTQCGYETTIVQMGSKNFLFDAAVSKIYFTKNSSLVERLFGHSENRPLLV